MPGEMFALAMAAQRERGMGVVGSTQNILDFISANVTSALQQPFSNKWPPAPLIVYRLQLQCTAYVSVSGRSCMYVLRRCAAQWDRALRQVQETRFGHSV